MLLPIFTDFVILLSINLDGYEVVLVVGILCLKDESRRTALAVATHLQYDQSGAPRNTFKPRICSSLLAYSAVLTEDHQIRV